MIKSLLSTVVAAMLTVPGAAVAPHQAVPVIGTNVAIVEEVQEREFRGVWVTTVINLDFPSSPGLSNAEIKREIDYIIADSRSLNLNAIVLQVRPAGDAIYPSAIYPWSKYLTGEQGLAPADAFDPLAYWLEQSHANGLELHAWINPYRVTHGTSRITDVNALHPSNPARQRPDLVVKHGDALFLDPGFPDSRQLIIAGIQELLHNYDLDGIHFDDYFYPDLEFDDSASHAIYGMGLDKHTWRVNNVNSLVAGVQQAINEINPEVSFGISPTGIWANKGSHPLGSETRGYQHYFTLAADSRRWVEEGWIDYIVPQIYWHIGFDIANYETLLRWWEDLVRGTEVDLYIGHAAYREHANEANFNGEMLRQLQMNETSDVVTGSVFFRWASLQGNVGQTVQNWYANRPQELTRTVTSGRQPVVTMNELSVVLPSRDITVGLDAVGHNVWGASIPNLPLFLNGEPVTNRTPEGFFSMYVPLQNGQNILAFSQPGRDPVVRTITRSAPAAPPAAVTPATPAPIIPDRVYAKEEAHYATLTANAAWLHPRASTTGGSNWLITNGMQDRIIASAQNGRWVRLSNGGWLESAHIERTQANAVTENILSNGTFERDGHIETVTWQVAGETIPMARTVYEDGKLTVFFGMQSQPPHMRDRQPPTDSIFKSMTSGVTDEGIAYITFEIKDDLRLNGYDISEAEGNLKFTVMTPRPLNQDWRLPFEGFTFVIDPGHGGSDYGALGPMGTQLAEKHITLTKSMNLAERLENMGAEVYLIRDENDTDITLRERVMFSRGVRPDMFISIHANSVAETTDATNIRGFTVWYRNETSLPAANMFLNSLHDINPNTNRWANTNQANFYVCRPTWTPSVLLEASFMSNIEDFVWMITPEYQDRFATNTIAALINYYRIG